MPMRVRLRPEQRRELILDAAAAEFGRRGHREARLEDIARAAGTTKAVVYDHFAGKAQLHAEVVRRAAADLQLAVTTAVLAAPAAPADRFRAGVAASFALIVERPDVRTLLLGEPGLPPEVSEVAIAAQREARAAMAELYLLEPSFLRGHPRRRERARHLAQGGIGAMNGLAVLAVQDGLSAARLADLAVDLLWPGLAAQQR